MSLLQYERGKSILSVPSQMSNCHIHDNNYIHYTSVYLVYIYTCVKCIIATYIILRMLLCVLPHNLTDFIKGLF